MQEPGDDFEFTSNGPDYSKFTWAVLYGVGMIIIGIKHIRHPTKYYNHLLRGDDLTLGTWDDLTKNEDNSQ